MSELKGAKFKNHGYNMWSVQSRSTEKRRYLTLHPCPICETPHVICSCKDFTIGRARMAQNALSNPCDHVKEFQRQIKLKKNNIEPHKEE